MRRRWLLPLVFAALAVSGSHAANPLRSNEPDLENLVQIDERLGRLEVKMFLDGLFLPSSDILRDDAYVILDYVITRIRLNPERRVVFTAVDPIHWRADYLTPNLSRRRCTVVFSYLLYQSENRQTLKR